jgi:hypothetical protein
LNYYNYKVVFKNTDWREKINNGGIEAKRKSGFQMKKGRKDPAAFPPSI